MYFHNLNPIAFKILGFEIYWYSLAYLFGFIISFFYSNYLIKKKLIHLKREIIDDLITYAIIGVVLGGRLGYVLFYNLSFYINNPIEIIKIWNGGMSFHGGLIGLITSTYLVSYNKKESLVELLNLVACCGPIGIFLGRLANFINGELIGKPTNSSWGVLFHPEDVLRHPSQLYEAFFEGFLIFFITYFILKKFKKKINTFSVFLISYSVLRFFVEFFREPDAHIGFVFKNLSMGQILCFPMLLFGIAFVKYGKN